MSYVRFGKESLGGLAGVAVAAEDVKLASALEAGLGRQELQGRLESQLFENGVAVLSYDGLAATPGQPILYLRLSLMPVLPKAYAYSLILYLMQQATLYTGDQTQAVTWEHGTVGTVVKNDWKSLEEALERAVGRFIKDFKKVNAQPPDPPKDLGEVN